VNIIEGNIYVIQLTVYYVCVLQNVIFSKFYGVTQYRWEVVPDGTEDCVAFVLNGVTDYLAK
jgi:hypothetical protein